MPFARLILEDGIIMVVYHYMENSRVHHGNAPSQPFGGSEGICLVLGFWGFPLKVLSIFDDFFGNLVQTLRLEGGWGLRGLMRFGFPGDTKTGPALTSTDKTTD